MKQHPISSDYAGPILLAGGLLFFLPVVGPWLAVLLLGGWAIAAVIGLMR